MNNIYPVINEDTLGDEIDRVSLTDVEIENMFYIKMIYLLIEQTHWN